MADGALGAMVVVRGPDASDVIDAIRRGAGQRLPRPAVPTRLVVVEALPQSPNGKLDRRAVTASLASGSDED